MLRVTKVERSSNDHMQLEIRGSPFRLMSLMYMDQIARQVYVQWSAMYWVMYGRIIEVEVH